MTLNPEQIENKTKICVIKKKKKHEKKVMKAFFKLTKHVSNWTRLALNTKIIIIL